MTNPRPRVRVAAAMAVCAVLATTGCGRSVQTNGSNTLSVHTYTSTQKVTVPELSGAAITQTAANGTLTYQPGTGKVTVLNVWASWCPPCRKEGPDFARIARETPSAQFIGIDTRDTVPAAQAYLRSNAIGYASMSDPDGALVQKLGNIVPVSAFPSTIVIDRHGMVSTAITGPADATTLKEAISDAAKQ